MRTDVSYSTEIITALNHRGGLPNTTVEIISLIRSCDDMRKITEAQRNNKFRTLWRRSEFRFYDEGYHDRLYVYFYSTKMRKYIKWADVILNWKESQIE